MTELRGTGRKYLRGLAHGLRPVVQIGKEGLTAAILAAIRDALSNTELIKVRVVADKDEKRGIAQSIDLAAGTTCVGIVGHILILYREHPDAGRRTIRIPQS